jgi:hypothetical protein
MNLLKSINLNILGYNLSFEEELKKLKDNINKEEI